MTAVRPIVVVDDDVDHALIIRLVLGQIAPGADVTVMTDPRLLAERLARAPLGALVLIDRVLDGSDGCALLPVLRDTRPDLRLVLLSAVLGERDRRRALAAGADAAAEKPSSIAAWRHLLTTMLGAAEDPQRDAA